MRGRAKTARASGPRPRLIAAGILALACAAAWLPSFPGTSGRTTGVWRGYETLLLGADIARSGRLARLVRDMGPGVVSELTAQVSFWDFTGVDHAPIAGLDGRIDPSDPRHDRVMDDLAGYFRASAGPGAPWTVVFVPARRAPVLDYIRVARILGPRSGAWRLLEFDPVEAVVALAGLAAFALFLAGSSPSGRRLTRVAASVSAAALWIPFVLGGGLARLALSLLMLFTWFRAADVVIALHGWDQRVARDARRALVAFAACAGAGLVLLVPAGGFAAGALAAFAGAAAGSVLLLAALGLYWGRARRPRAPRRTGFTPVPIVKPAAPAGPGPAGVLLALAALIVAAVVPLARTVPVPTPIALPGVRDFSWQALATLDRSGRSPRLPDLGDLVAHEAFQETIAFGRPWGPPRAGEHVNVRGFIVDPADGTVVAVQRRVKVFDDAWLASCLRGAPGGSIEALLVAQGRAVAVGLRGSAHPLARELPVAVLVIAWLLASLARTPQAARAGRRPVPLMKGLLLRLNGAARRNQTP